MYSLLLITIGVLLGIALMGWIEANTGPAPDDERYSDWDGTL